MLHASCFSAALLVAAAQDTPGFQFIGFGYDALYGNPRSTQGDGDPGFRTNVFKFAHTQGQKSSDGKWDVPDKTTSQDFGSSCSLEQNTKIITSAYGYQHIVDNDVSFNAGFDGNSFSLSADFKRIDNQTRSNTSIFADVSAKCTAYQLTMHTFDHPDLDPNFVDAVDTLPDHYDEKTYMRFIQAFGTHVVTQLQVGGRWGWQMTFNRFAYNTMLDNSIDIEFGIQVAAQATAGTNFNHTDDTKNSMAVTQSISKNSSFNVGGTFSPDKDKWMASVKAKPMPTHLVLTALDELITTNYLPNTTNATLLSSRATAMGEAIKNYCQYVKKNLDPSAICTRPQPLPAPVPDPVAADAVRRICVLNHGVYKMYWELHDLTTQYPVKRATDSYAYGQTNCLDGLQVGANRGDKLNCRAEITWGNERDCLGNGVVYDARATQQANFACDGSTFTGSCKFTGYSAYGDKDWIAEVFEARGSDMIVV